MSLLETSKDDLLQTETRPRRTQLEHGTTRLASAVDGAVLPSKLTLPVTFHLEPATFCNQRVSQCQPGGTIGPRSPTVAAVTWPLLSLPFLRPCSGFATVRRVHRR